MRITKGPIAAIAALSMVATPVLAQSTRTTTDSAVTAPARSGYTMEDVNNSRGNSLLLGLGVAALIAVGILVLAKGKDDPASP